MTLIADGLTAVAVGRALGISPHTVRKHAENAYAKLGVCDPSFARAPPERPGDRAVSAGECCPRTVEIDTRSGPAQRARSSMAA